MTTNGGFYITQIKQLQGRIFERLLTKYGLDISGGQGSILFVLWKEDGLTISEIGSRTSLAKNTVSIIIDGMAAKGIVSRTSNPHNRRQTIVSLTDAAKAMKDRYEKVSEEMGILFYDGFTPDEIIQFENYLSRILHTLTQREPELKCSPDTSPAKTGGTYHDNPGN